MIAKDFFAVAREKCGPASRRQKVVRPIIKGAGQKFAQQSESVKRKYDLVARIHVAQKVAEQDGRLRS